MAKKHQIFSSNKKTRQKANRSWRRKAKSELEGIPNKKLKVKPKKQKKKKRSTNQPSTTNLEEMEEWKKLRGKVR